MNLNEIKEALSKVTPGPWESTGTRVERDTGEPLSRGYVTIAALTGNYALNNPNHEADAHLIANAPEWLASLVAQVEIMHDALESLYQLIQRGDLTSFDLGEAEIVYTQVLKILKGAQQP